MRLSGLERFANIDDLVAAQDQAEQMLVVLRAQVDALEKFTVGLAALAGVLAAEHLGEGARTSNRRAGPGRPRSAKQRSVAAGDEEPTPFPVGPEKPATYVDRVLALLELEDKAWRSRDIAESLKITREQVDGALKNLCHRKHQIVHTPDRRWRAAKWVSPGAAVA